MGQYFKRMAHRTGLFEKTAHTRQAVPAAVHSDVMEISQEITSPVPATEYGSADNKVRTPTNAAPIQAEALGERHAAASTVPMHTKVPPHIKTPMPDLFTNITKENQDIELSNQEPKQLNPTRTETTKTPVSAQRGLLENLISPTYAQKFSEPTGSKGPGIFGKEKVNEAKSPLSISEISTLVSAHDELITPSTNASGLPYGTSSPMPEKIPVETRKQNIEIRIGSVTMEVHQKQPKHPAVAQSRSNGTPPGFRPGRYYLRGL